MSKLFLVTTSLLFLAAACKEQQHSSNLMPELATCDSAAIMYYHEPGKPRFFNMAKVYDKESLIELADNVNGPLITGRDSCTTQGKIYAYGKGDAVYVVYFTRAANCMTLSFIKTGEKYFVSMNEKTKKWLVDMEKKAKEPSSDMQD